MYCSACGAAVSQGLSYCNYCGAKLSGANGDNVIKSSGVKPELLVSAMVGLFVLGLVAIAVLIGVLKAVAGFDLPFLLAATMLSFVLLLVVKGVLIGLLLKGKRGFKEAGDTERLKEHATKELGEAQARVLPEPEPSVTEHTTRAFEPIYSERKSK
ncbi:MAG: zinc ribbon domain-containing protein [Acidobacteriota bacterium]|nr:zinc ribbon domain-containing protein [Acidobacteriota bacterium]